MVLALKKEVMKTQSKELEKASEYRQLLVHAIHTCAVKFPDIAGNVRSWPAETLQREYLPYACVQVMLALTSSAGSEKSASQVLGWIRVK